jgi:hypothetical protein
MQPAPSPGLNRQMSMFDPVACLLVPPLCRSVLLFSRASPSKPLAIASVLGIECRLYDPIAFWD